MIATTEPDPECLDTAVGVITERRLAVVDGLPATPNGLLDIAAAFEGECYFRLGRYLRACAEQMTANTASAFGPFDLVWMDAAKTPLNGTTVKLVGPADAFDQLSRLRRYALVEVAASRVAAQEVASDGI